MNRFLSRGLTAIALTSAAVFADPVTVDLADAEASVTNAGTAMIGVAVVMLGIGLVYSFIKRRA